MPRAGLGSEHQSGCLNGKLTLPVDPQLLGAWNDRVHPWRAKPEGVLVQRARILHFGTAGLPVCSAACLMILTAAAYLQVEPAPEPFAEPVMEAAASGTEAVPLPRQRPREPVVTGSVAPRPALRAAAAGDPVGDLLEQIEPERLADLDAVHACEDKVRNGLPRPWSLTRRQASTDVSRAPGDNPVVSFDFDALSGFGYPLWMQVQCVFEDRGIARLEMAPR
jgi:hypothetical protein